MQKILSIPHQDEEGIQIELSTKEHCITEILSLRRSLYSIKHNLEIFKSITSYNTLSRFGTKYIDDCLLGCEQELNVNYVTK